MLPKRVRFSIWLLSILTILLTGLISVAIMKDKDIMGNSGKEIIGLKLNVAIQKRTIQPIQVVEYIEPEVEEEPVVEPVKKSDLSIIKEKIKPIKKPKVKPKVKLKPKPKPKPTPKVKPKPKKQAPPVVPQKKQPSSEEIRRGKLLVEYKKKIVDIIQSYMTEPFYLEKNRTSVIKFKIDNNGNILFANVKKTSGNPDIDYLAREDILSINKLPTPPIEIQNIDLTFQIPLIYKIDGMD